MAAYIEKAQRFVDQDNQFTQVLKQVEERTGIKKVHQFFALCGIAVLWLMVGYGASLVCSLIGFVYPAYRSLKALETEQMGDDRQWLIYWTVYAAFIVAEFFTDFLLSWIPFFFLLKAAFLVWCMLPGEANGSMILYNKIIRPFFLKHEEKLDKLVEKGFDEAREIGGEATELAQGLREQATELAIKEGIKHMTDKKDD